MCAWNARLRLVGLSFRGLRRLSVLAWSFAKGCVDDNVQETASNVDGLIDSVGPLTKTDVDVLTLFAVPEWLKPAFE